MTTTVETTGPIVELRAATPEDLPLIFASWKKGASKSHAMRWSKTDAWRELNKRCPIILDRCGALVACSPEDPDYVIGWICADRSRNLVHYVYVRSQFRGFGIARLLAGASGIDPEKPIEATHWTPAAERIQYTKALRFLPRAVYT